MPLAIVSCQFFVNRKTDKTGIMLSPVAGKLPFKRVLSQEVASNAGFVPGKLYLAEWNELEPDDVYGRRFSFKNHSEVSIIDSISLKKEMGEGKVMAEEVILEEA